MLPVQRTISRLVPGHYFITRGIASQPTVTQLSFADDMTLTPKDRRAGMFALDSLWLSAFITGHVIAIAANGAKTAVSVAECYKLEGSSSRP